MDSAGSEWEQVIGYCEKGNRIQVSNRRRRISCSYESQFVSTSTLYYCNIGLLHDNRWSLCLCNVLWCTVVSFYSYCCLNDIFLFYAEVSGEYGACVVTKASSTWMLKIKTANSFENCRMEGGEEKGADHYVFSVCVFKLPEKQRLYFPPYIRFQLNINP